MNMVIEAEITSLIQRTLDSLVNTKNIFGAVVQIESGDLDIQVQAAAGNLKQESRYFIASTTKLFTSSIIFMLRNEGKIDLEDNISKYIPGEILRGLHIYKDRDYSNQITIKHLLSHTSGLPDYFQDKGRIGTSLKKQLTLGIDKKWSAAEAIEFSKRMTPKFVPGKKGKAYYSDTNFQLLGIIIEQITGKTISQVYEGFIFKPLELVNTYLYKNEKGVVPVKFYYKANELTIPKAMSSFGPDGGIVSTAKDTMVFLKAFFNGALFPQKFLDEIQRWNKIFFPLEYGIGIARFKIPWMFSPFKNIPEMIGHSGLSGAFAFYVPEKNIYMTGTVNQINNPGTSYKLIIKLLNEIGKEKKLE